MPEGPSVRNTADRLRVALEGQHILSFSSRFKKAAPERWADHLVGHTVIGVRVHGKNMFMDFEHGYTLYTHFLMWGAWHVYERDEPWQKDARKSRVVIETARNTVVLFSAPVCDLIVPGGHPQHPTSLLGPDLLADDFGPADEAEIAARLGRDPAQPLGAAIMDQTVMAGIGNILKSEILFDAHLNPLRPAGDLSADERHLLIERSRHYLRRAYETGGFIKVFLPPLLQQLGKLGYVYQRSGQPCHKCGSIIQMVRQGFQERTTFYCPHCQPLDPSSPPPPAEMMTMETPFTGTVHTLEEARDFVLSVELCGILHDSKGKLPTLWDAIAAPDKQPGEGGWGERMAQTWTWKNLLPATYPDEIFYGKIKGGRAVLMSMPKLRSLYRSAHKPVSECSEIAQQLYEIIAIGPIPSVPLRRAAGLTDRNSRAAFDRALLQLQVTFNITRSNAPGLENDTWVPFTAQYPDFEP